MAVLAHFEQIAVDRRASARQVLKLQTDASFPSKPTGWVLIHNLSNDGLLIETEADLEVGDNFDLELPEATGARAIVMWRRGRYFGCELSDPLTQGALSAALLKNPFNPPAGEQGITPDEGAAADPIGDTGELPVGVRLWIIVGLSLAVWAVLLALIWL